MDEQKIYKTVKQYSKPLPPETMAALREIAEDCAAVKAYVYSRYSGIRGMGKVYQAYTVQNELAETGLREQLGIPTVYFGLAMFSALTDIKSAWSNLRRRLVPLVRKNENLNDEERHYIYMVLKSDRLYEKVLNREPFDPPKQFAGKLDFKRLHNLICRLTRRHKTKMTPPENQDYFETYRRAYAYKKGGIAMATKVPYKRVFIPLTDNCKYDCQITVHLLEDRIVLSVPIEVRVKKHADYTNRIGAHLGYVTMITTSDGRRYGEKLGEMLSVETERITCVLARRNRLHGRYRVHRQEGEDRKAENIRRNNLGRKKYERQKEKNDVRIKTYINAELNRLLETEKPAEICVSSMSKQFAGQMSGAVKQKLSRWQIGYIRRRLEFKCRLQSVNLRLVNPAYTGRVCSDCGGLGVRKGQLFRCGSCGAEMDYGTNAARNLLKKSEGDFREPV